MDIFFDVKWRWEYYQDGKIINLEPFCPHCDFELTVVSKDFDRIGYYLPPGYDYNPRTECTCERCNEVVSTIEGRDLDSLGDFIEKEIRRNIRTGDFKKSSP